MRFILIGIQGSGKSTQGNLLSKKLGVAYIATGDIFRSLAKEESPSGTYIKEMLAGGHLIPDEKTIAILKEYLAKSEYQKGYILDGFPRTLVQAQSFDEPIDNVISIDVPDDEALKRLALRADKEKREDDSEDAVKRRIALFHEKTQPLLDFYKNKGLLVQVDGTKTIEEIHEDIMKNIATKR